MNNASFLSELDFDPNRIKIKLILETSFSKELRILFTENQVMKDHKTPFPIIIQVLDGKINLDVEGEIFSLNAGDIIQLEGNLMHNLTALKNSIVRLTISKFDEVERVMQVAEK